MTREKTLDEVVVESIVLHAEKLLAADKAMAYNSKMGFSNNDTVYGYQYHSHQLARSLKAYRAMNEEDSTEPDIVLVSETAPESSK